MKKAATHDQDEVRVEYDFSSAVKNPYAKRFARGSNIVMIKPEIFAAFPSEEAVNEALALLMQTEAKSGKQNRGSRRSSFSKAISSVRSR